MFLIIPYHVDVPMRCRPWMNWVLIGLTVVFYPLCISDGDFTDFGERLVLGGGHALGYVGHVLVHADILHLLGNMLFLWVFGNAVCAKIGNLPYFFTYFGLGLAAGGISYAIQPLPAVGASGAINGIVGMFVVWYLVNEISCWYGYWFFGIGNSGVMSVSSFWMILLWLAFDIFGAVRGSGHVGYVAHLAGFGVGFLTAILLLTFRLIEMERGEKSLLQVLGGDKSPREESKSGSAKGPKRKKKKKIKDGDSTALQEAMQLEEIGKLRAARRRYEKILLSSVDAEVREEAQLRKSRLEEKIAEKEQKAEEGESS